MKRRFKTKNAAITLSTDFRQEVNDSLRAIPSVSLQRLEQERKRIYEQARDTWPILTGESRDCLYVTAKVTEHSIKVLIATDDEGGYKIRSSKVGTEENRVRTRNPWQEHVRKPVFDSVKAVAEDLAELATKSINEAFNGKK